MFLFLDDKATLTQGLREMIKESVLLYVLNVVLPSLDVYSDLAIIAVFYTGSRENPFCQDFFQTFQEWYYAVNQYQINDAQDMDDLTESEQVFIEADLQAKWQNYTSYYPQFSKLTPWRGWEFESRCNYDDSIPTSDLIYTPHYGWGTLMLLPFLLNYLICWYIWATNDMSKLVSWVAPLLSFYPQYVALKIIFLIWANPQKSLEKKRLLERNITQMETFYEAVPSLLIIFYLKAQRIRGSHGSEIIVDEGNERNYWLFLVALSTSTMTSALGLAKNLKVGPCRILPDQKRLLGGLLSPKFLLIFFACALTLVGKGVILATKVLNPYEFLDGSHHTDPCWQNNKIEKAAIVVCTVFLPGLFLSLFSCWHPTILKTFLVQPSIFLLPVFSHFTFMSTSGETNGKGDPEKIFIIFSSKYTAINAGMSLFGFLTNILLLYLISPNHWTCLEDVYLVNIGLPCFFTGLLLSLIVAWSTSKSRSLKNKFEFGALVTAEPYTPYKLGHRGQLEKEEKATIERNKEVIVCTVRFSDSGMMCSTF